MWLAHTRAAWVSGVSIKSLTLAPHITAPAAVHAVTVETLKHMPVLQPLLERTQLLEQTPGLSHAVACVLIRECLFGPGLRPTGKLERAVLGQQDVLQRELKRLLDEAGVEAVAELLPAGAGARGAAGAGRPRTARVNTLKMGVQEALAWLRSPPAPHSRDAKLAAAGREAVLDAHLPDVLLLPPGTDMHAHPLVRSGALVLQTLMRNQGRVLAFDKDARRLARLQRNAELAGATCVAAACVDWLSADPSSAELAGAHAVLLDPSCSGSGTAASRGDNLLPSAAAAPRGAAAVAHTDARVEALAQFQEAALRHALSFPAARRLVYSTCSVHARENEGVVAAVLGEAAAAGWRLEAAIPGWPRRGVAGLVEGAELLARTDPEEDGTDGFFVALFVRDTVGGAAAAGADGEGLKQSRREKKRKKQRRRQQQTEG
eukprot:scaffold20.g7726.t1